MANDTREAPTAAMEPLDDYDNAPDVGGDDDDDFGALPMFDSNTLQSTYSSQMDNSPSHAPEAVMSEEVPLSHTSKKSKRSKKDKKKKSSRHAMTSSPFPAANGSSNEVNGSDAVDAPEPATDNVLAAEDVEATPTQAVEEMDSTSTRTKKKRKLSDTAESKRRKKRRPEESVVEEAVAEAEDGEAGDEASAFLHTADFQPDITEAVAAEAVAEAEQASPSAGRARKSRKSRGRQWVDDAAPNPDEMDIDTAQASLDPRDVKGEAHAEIPEDGLAEGEMESLAREAWNEHVSGQVEAENALQEAASADMANESLYPEPDQGAFEAEDAVKDEPTPTPRKRSTRPKKAKPTYFEQPAAEAEQDDDEAPGELPSPSAMTPAPRRRKKAATRKTKAPKLSQSMHGASDDEVAADGEDERPGRRNRMAGYTQGRFTDEELERMARALEKFRAENDLTQVEVNAMVQAPGGTTAGDAHAQLWMRIFAECPDRHRQKVINVARKKFHNFVARGTWTVEQDAELSELSRIHGTKWSKIAGIINRHPEDVRDRYRNYVVCGENQRKDAWDEAEEARLTKHVIEAMHYLDELRQEEPNNTLLHEKTDEELIDWQNISERMDRTRSRLQCITKWKSLNFKTHGKDTLESGNPDSHIGFRLEKARRQLHEMDEHDRYRLVLAIQDAVDGPDRKIPWAKLVDKPFRNKWHRTTQLLLWKRLKETLPGWENFSTKDAAATLIAQYNQNGSLPEVEGTGYDDLAEGKYMQGAAPTNEAHDAAEGNGVAPQASISNEFVTQSDVEDEDPAQNGNGVDHEMGMAETGVDDLKIDPALSAPMPQVTTPSPALRSPSRELASFKRQSKRNSALMTDPIEDEEQHAAWDQAAAVAADKVGGLVPDDGASDSVMDDMEDLPARVAV